MISLLAVYTVAHVPALAPYIIAAVVAVAAGVATAPADI